MQQTIGAAIHICLPGQGVEARAAVPQRLEPAPVPVYDHGAAKHLTGELPPLKLCAPRLVSGRARIAVARRQLLWQRIADTTLV